MPHKVVRVIARLNVGGPALHTMHLTAGLADEYPTLLVFGTVAAGERDMTPIAEARGLALYRIPSLGRELNPVSDLRVAVQLYRLLRRERPTIVHTHTAKAGFVGRLAAVLARVPVRVHTFHGHVFEGYFSKWKTRVFIRLERVMARLSTRIIAISDAQVSDLTTRFAICSPSKIALIPLGLDLARFAPERTASRQSELSNELGIAVPIISIVGRLEPIKNHELFLEAAALLAKRQPCHFAIVGGGTLESALRLRADALGIADRVHFLGWREDLDRIYSGSAIVALTSNNEGTPVALIEALAAGRPVVARDVGGVVDVLDSGRRGTLVTSSQAVDFADALEETLLRPEDTRTRTRISREIMAAYGVERLVADIARLYETLIDDAIAS